MTLQRAYGLFQAGQLAGAEGLCRGVLSEMPDSVDAQHLLALIKARQGQLADAEALMRRTIALQPGRAEFRLNLGNLLRRAGRQAEAAEEYGAALQVDPGFRAARLALLRLQAQSGQASTAEAHARELLRQNSRDAEAWSGLGAALRAQARLAEAESAYRRALALRPDYAIARHNLGALLSQLHRAEEALTELDRAARQGALSPELCFNRARALIELGRFDEAEAALLGALQRDGSYLDAHVTLARLRFVRGDPSFARELEAAVARDGRRIQFALALAQLLRGAGRLEQAEALLREALRVNGAAPGLQLELVAMLQEAHRVEEALAVIDDSPALMMGGHSALSCCVSVLLSGGRAAQALPFIEAVLARDPSDQLFLAYLASATRQLGDERYGLLYDYDNLVKVYDLSPPHGWGSLEAFHGELARVLAERHSLQAHPLDQSLRHGTQTVRSLLHDPVPQLRAFLEHLVEPIAAYQAALGRQPGHPMRVRNTAPARLTGCWSVRLGAGGFHVNHVHPHGWLSSVYYVSVPSESADASRRVGWLKLGEPRFAMPGAEPERFIPPMPGRLVLFPSYMWHGTTAIQGEEPRLTIAFDAVPGAEALES